MAKVSKKQIADFRSKMEATMREMKDKNGNPCISESEIQDECYNKSDAYIANLIKDGTRPDVWADLVTSY